MVPRVVQPKEPVEIAGNEVGPYTRLGITSRSRCAEISFPSVLGFFSHSENFDSTDPDLVFESDQSFVRQVHASSLRNYVNVATGIAGVWWGELLEFHVWTEDQLFQVFCTEPPLVAIVPGQPDMSIQRGESWSAS